MSETRDKAAPAAPAASKGGGLIKLLAIVIVAVVAAGGGVFWWTTQSAKAQAKAEKEPPKPATRGLLKFDPFVVNLADGAGSRFLRASLQLVVEPSEQAEEISKNAVQMSQVRSILLELLAQQTAAALVTPEGKAAMKAAIISRAQDALDGGKIADVLFSEFVVQF